MVGQTKQFEGEVTLGEIFMAFLAISLSLTTQTI